jgi:serine/threonine protein kinase
MRKLNHSNILKLFEVYESDNSIYLILELIKGGSLSDRIKGSKAKFTAEEVRGLMWGILEGLNHVHTARIAHRDVKLDNILLK